MPDKPKEDQKEETTPEFDAVVEKLLKTPPKPHDSKKDEARGKQAS